MSPVVAIFAPFPPKTGTNMLHPPPPQSLNLSQAEKNRLFFFSAPPRYGAVRRPNNFFDPPKKISAPNCFFIRGPKPKIAFFGGRLRSNIFRRPSEKTSFFFFSAPPRYGVRRPNNFFDPPKKISAPKCFFIRGPKPKIGFFGGRLRSNIFRRPGGKTSFFFFFRRRLVMVFGGQITFSTPPKKFSAP